MFDNAFGLTEGGDFRVGGVNAGKTTDFDVLKRPGEAPKAVVTAEITEPGLEDFRADASCEIRPQSLIGEYYVDCQPGSSDEKLAERGRGAGGADRLDDPARTWSTTSCAAPTASACGWSSPSWAPGWRAAPRTCRRCCAAPTPVCARPPRRCGSSGDQNAVIEDFIADADTVVGELERNKRDVVRWMREAGDTAEITATRREELRAGIRRCPASSTSSSRPWRAWASWPTSRSRCWSTCAARRPISTGSSRAGSVRRGQPPGRALAR